MPASIDPTTITKDEWAYCQKALLDRREHGEDVYIPHEKAVGIMSGVSGKAGIDALTDDVETLSYFSPWAQKGWKKMDPRVRAAVFQKSLRELGYKSRANPFKSFGHFLQEGFADSKSNDFRAKHAAPFKSMDGAYFKARGMSTAMGSDGKFLLQPEFSPKIHELLFDNSLPAQVDNLSFNGPIMRILRSKSANRSDGARNGGIVADWIDEGGNIAEARAGLTYTELRMKKLAVVVFVTEELMSDLPSTVEDYIFSQVRNEFNFQTSRAYMWGEGGPEPKGFARSKAALEVAKEPTQANGSDDIIAANILKMEARLFEQPGSTPSWFYHRSCTSSLGQMTIGGQPIYINIGGIADAPKEMLRGMPAQKTEFAAAVGDAGDLWLADLNMYKTITRSAVRQDVSMHVEFLSDQQAIRFIFGVDGAPLYDEQIQPWQAGPTTPPTQSSYVYLGAR